MTHWLIPANTKFYDVIAAFNFEETYWPVNTKVSISDIVYVYLAAPYKQIAYSCEVFDIKLKADKVLNEVSPFFNGRQDDDPSSKEFKRLRILKRLDLSKESLLSLAELKEHGLKGMLMGARKLDNNPELLSYVGSVMA